MSGAPPELPQNRIWYYEKDGQQNGPVTAERLTKLSEMGEVQAETLVWKDGLPDWVPARRLRFLAFTTSSTPDNLGEDLGMRMLIPVGRSGWAIAAGYLGLVSILVLPAPFALFTGIMAVREIRSNPKKHGMGRAIFGIIMGALCTLPLLFLIGAYLWAVTTGQPFR